MNHDQIALIRKGWSRIAPFAGAAIAAFYERLFEIAPDLAQRFSDTDMNAQHVKLAGVFDTAITGLDDPGSLVPVLRDLGARHVAYGVDAADYEAVGAALLWTLQTGLDEDWTEEAAEAWAGAYRVIVDAMLQGAASRKAA